MTPQTTRIRKLALLTILALAMAACAGAASAQPQLDGSHWQLYSLNGEVIRGDSLPTISFENGEVGGSGGCNSYGGSYQADPAAGSISITEIFSTLMACVDNEVSRIESDFFAALQDVDSYAIDRENALRLYSAGSELVFYPQP